MAKLIHILAASLGGGLVLGAGMVVGEALGNSVRKNGRRRVHARLTSVAETRDPFLANRLDRLEERLSRVIEAAPPAETAETGIEARLAEVIARIERQQDEISALARKAADGHPAQTTAEGVRDEIREQVSAELDERLRAMEEKMQLTVNNSQRETANAMLTTIEQRIAPRIGRVESEIGEQAAALAELRDCSLKSERSVLRLVGVLERMSVPKARAEDSASASETTPNEGFTSRLAVRQR